VKSGKGQNGSKKDSSKKEKDGKSQKEKKRSNERKPCNFCGKMGHEEDTCFKKKASVAAAQAELDDEGSDNSPGNQDFDPDELSEQFWGSEAKPKWSRNKRAKMHSTKIKFDSSQEYATVLSQKLDEFLDVSSVEGVDHSITETERLELFDEDEPKLITIKRMGHECLKSLKQKCRDYERQFISVLF